jgi:hypothetical protein
LQSNQAEGKMNELLIGSFSEFITAGNVEKALPIFVYFPDGGKKKRLSQILGQRTDEKVIARLVHADLDWKVRMNRIGRDRFEYGSVGGVAALYQRLVGNPGSGSSVQLGGVTEELLAPHRRILEERFPFLAELEGSEARKAKEAATRNAPGNGPVPQPSGGAKRDGGAQGPESGAKDAAWLGVLGERPLRPDQAPRGTVGRTGTRIGDCGLRIEEAGDENAARGRHLPPMPGPQSASPVPLRPASATPFP